MKRTIGPPEASCRLYTEKEGLLSAVAHDLELTVERFRLELDEEAGQAEGWFDAKSVKVVTAMASGRPSGALSASDKKKIESNLADEVLRSARFPEIHFRLTELSGQGEERTLRGTLTLVGKSRAIELRASRAISGWTVTGRLHQPDFGIAPYSAMFGTLKIKPDVRVELRVQASSPVAPGG